MKSTNLLGLEWEPGDMGGQTNCSLSSAPEAPIPVQYDSESVLNNIGRDM